MSDIKEARKALLRRIRDGAGMTSSSDRRAAFDLKGLTGPVGSLVDKVALHASRVTDEDIAAVKASGFTEDQIFEIVVCTAVGQANRQFEVALDALEAASETE